MIETEALNNFYQSKYPFELIARWLEHPKIPFEMREFSFTLQNSVYIRYNSFGSAKAFRDKVQKLCPQKIDIGALYNYNPQQRKSISGDKFQPQERELVFDIDMTDYDDTRTCCQDKDICMKCWVFMKVAYLIIDAALKEDFGFEQVLWVFSGRRGIHCWITDPLAKSIEANVRRAVCGYLDHAVTDKEHIHTKRSMDICMKYVPDLLRDQKKLLNDEKLKKLGIVDREVQECLTQVDRWHLIIEKNLISEKTKRSLVFEWRYPRLDVNVTFGMNHLLKSPFCVHPSTGKVCVPIFDIEKFNLAEVPDVHGSVDKYTSMFDEWIEQWKRGDESQDGSVVNKRLDW